MDAFSNFTLRYLGRSRFPIATANYLTYLKTKNVSTIGHSLVDDLGPLSYGDPPTVQKRIPYPHGGNQQWAHPRKIMMFSSRHLGHVWDTMIFLEALKKMRVLIGKVLPALFIWRWQISMLQIASHASRACGSNLRYLNISIAGSMSSCRMLQWPDSWKEHNSLPSKSSQSLGSACCTP